MCVLVSVRVCVVFVCTVCLLGMPVCMYVYVPYDVLLVLQMVIIMTLCLLYHCMLGSAPDYACIVVVQAVTVVSINTPSNDPDTADLRTACFLILRADYVRRGSRQLFKLPRCPT